MMWNRYFSSIVFLVCAMSVAAADSTSVQENKYEQRMLRKEKMWAKVSLAIIIGGGIGNMIDRFSTGSVVDFIYFVIINFPIFNVADIYVTVSTFLFVILFLFYYKENDFNFLSFKQQKKFREIK